MRVIEFYDGFFAYYPHLADAMRRKRFRRVFRSRRVRCFHLRNVFVPYD